MNIIDLIPYGKENAISRAELRRITKINDRNIREYISAARREHAIINLQNGDGYYRPTKAELDELERYIKQEQRRAKSIFWCLKGAKKTLDTLKGE